MWEMGLRRKSSSHRAFDFLAHGDAGGVGSNDIDGGPPQDREVLWAVVFSGSTGIFAEDDIEHPMRLVLDARVTTYDLQQSLCREVLGQQVIAHDGLAGWFAMQSSARGDAN